MYTGRYTIVVKHLDGDSEVRKIFDFTTADPYIRLYYTII